METWLILLGVLLPLVPLLQVAERRLSAPGRSRPLRVETRRPERPQA